MIQVIFENLIGKIKMGFGQNIRIIDINGLGLLPKERNTVSYADSVGQSVLSETVGARTITIKADLKINGDAKVQREKLISILNSKGELKFIFDRKKRKISCICTNLEWGEKMGNYQEIIIQFVADYPYFSDFNNVIIPIFTRQAKLSTRFSLPCVFSNRTEEINIINGGDVATEPKLIITAIASSALSGDIIIKNCTTDTAISFLHSMTVGEVIEVDVGERCIISSVHGDITSTISDDSFFSDFYFAVGDNHIIVTNQSGGEIGVECEFMNHYIEGVF